MTAANFIRSTKAPHNQPGSNNRKGHLEHHHDGLREIISPITFADAIHEEVTESSEPVSTRVIKSEAIKTNCPHDGRESGNGIAVHQHRKNILGTNQAPIKKSQTRKSH